MMCDRLGMDLYQNFIQNGKKTNTFIQILIKGSVFKKMEFFLLELKQFKALFLTLIVFRNIIY
jgi:hypothetical protein